MVFEGKGSTCNEKANEGRLSNDSTQRARRDAANQVGSYSASKEPHHMDSNRIQKLAQGVRTALVKEVGDSLDRVLRPESPARLAEPAAVARVEALADRLGHEALVEQVAYTWFNRLCALRFMDERGYTSVGIVTARAGETLPAVLADARRGLFADGLRLGDAQRHCVSELLDGSRAARDPLGEAYLILLLAACEEYAVPMGYLFGGDVDMRHTMRLLAPAGLLNEGSVLERITQGMDAETCESVEVLGWLYQFYIAEQHDDFYGSKRKAAAEDIPAATQLFTPRWIVRYLVENSLGRLWMLNNPGSALAERMEYCIAPDPEDTEDFLKVGGPEELTLCDPACGSGHILVYAFELLYGIYEEEGYLSEEIPQLILENNLYGMEIDRRAAEIACFALEMCAREKDPHFLEKGVDAHITVLEPVRFNEGELAEAGLIVGNTRLLEAFEHLDEVGSLYVPDSGDKELVDIAIDNLTQSEGMFAGRTIDKLTRMRMALDALTGPYTCVVANPPYLGSGKFNPFMAKWTRENYPDEKNDLCTCFIRRGFTLACERGYIAIITSDTCMYLASCQALRKTIIDLKQIITFIDTRGSNAHPDVFDANAGWVLKNAPSDNNYGYYFRLNQRIGEKDHALQAAIERPTCPYCYRVNQSVFNSVPGSVIAYIASEGIIDAFDRGEPLSTYGVARQGLSTANNLRYLRLWWEVALTRFNRRDNAYWDQECKEYRWFAHNKGGSYRKWFGNEDYVIDWADCGVDLKQDSHAAIRNERYYFKASLTWSRISTGDYSVRYRLSGSLFDDTGASFFCNEENELVLLAFLNSSVTPQFCRVLSPTLHYEIGQVSLYPVLPEVTTNKKIVEIPSRCIQISRTDWDSFETSWDFSTHPLARPGEPLIKNQFSRWQQECDERFSQLKANEEELNRIFARIYGMEGEVPIEVPDDKVSVRRADLVRDVKSLISYGVGCIFGRYSTSAPDLVLADAQQTVDDFTAKVPEASFVPAEANVLPITNIEDFSFADDAARVFRAWLADTYGSDTLDDNIAFIENALGKDLRSYFAKDFYKDHCATYQVAGSGKRPIYWLFASPKGSFQALVYMHRMTRDTVSVVLTEYVRPFRTGLAARAAELAATGNARDASKANRYRQMVAEVEQWERDVLYPLSQQHVEIDLDDGVKVNYKKFGRALAKVQGLS